MPLIVLIYCVVTVLTGGKMIYHGLIWPGIALIIGSLIGFVAGSGARGAMFMGRRKPGIAFGLVLLIVGMGLAFYTHVLVTILGFDIAGDTWVGIGAVIGWFAAIPDDAIWAWQRGSKRRDKM